VARSVAEGFRVFQKTLEGEQLGISGVSIDEEAVRMISYQRTFQASARYIATISELLDVLVNL
jgi:flagellar hook-associated protein 1 FlgK